MAARSRTARSLTLCMQCCGWLVREYPPSATGAPRARCRRIRRIRDGTSACPAAASTGQCATAGRNGSRQTRFVFSSGDQRPGRPDFFGRRPLWRSSPVLHEPRPICSRLTGRRRPPASQCGARSSRRGCSCGTMSGPACHRPEHHSQSREHQWLCFLNSERETAAGRRRHVGAGSHVVKRRLEQLGLPLAGVA